MEDFEKLGVFYLGKGYDLATKKLQENLILYDSKDLTTHAVIIGMTGSGKTGLGIGLIEEAAIDNVPVLAIDPKGDLGNLLLTFPELRAGDFRTWINTQDATTKGVTPEAYAASQADMWRKGLGEWGQSADRIKRLRQAADFNLYTPGSSAGLPLSVLQSFKAPPAQIQEDADLYHDRIEATATSLLTLIGVNADPITSREHILLANIFTHFWNNAQDLDLAGLIGAIQNPPIQQIGVMNIEAFFPAKDRLELAMQLNNLLAAPGFAVWRQGTPLDVNQLLYTQSGQPRVSVISIAHLSDTERMFFVSMLLGEVLSWMRTQAGTTSLRAILYMDEIFGYLPPLSNPPTKKLFLTLLKQARAFGLGLVLATQNPVDLDYKGLSNTGTWLIGRLQTERDKARVMEGLEGAATGGNFNRRQMEQIIAGLGKRVFLMHNVHENAPTIFQTRWTMSYLAGPLTRDQIKTLMAPRKSPAKTGAPPTKPTAAARVVVKEKLLLPPELPQYFMPLKVPKTTDIALTYYPRVLGAGEITYTNARFRVQQVRRFLYVTDISDGPVAVDWNQAELLNLEVTTFAKNPVTNAAFADCPAPAQNPKNYREWGDALTHWLRTNAGLTLYQNAKLQLVSQPGESERDFRIRLQQAARELRDQQVDGLRKKYASRVEALGDQLERAEQRVHKEAAESRQRQLETAISVGSAILGAFLGRKAISSSTVSRVGGAVRSAGRIRKESQDVSRAESDASAIQQKIQALEAEFDAELQRLESSLNAQTETLESIAIQPRPTDIYLQIVGLAWLPYSKDAQGRFVPAW
ncbi:DUF87 domain-containing protein [candidate division KSB1 bacterium]|nr:DUF87 domain-containing protein [candidate division KSB1 bacterium]